MSGCQSNSKDIPEILQLVGKATLLPNAIN